MKIKIFLSNLFENWYMGKQVIPKTFYSLEIFSEMSSSYLKFDILRILKRPNIGDRPHMKIAQQGFSSWRSQNILVKDESKLVDMDVGEVVLNFQLNWWKDVNNMAIFMLIFDCFEVFTKFTVMILHISSTLLILHKK